MFRKPSLFITLGKALRRLRRIQSATFLFSLPPKERLIDGQIV